MFEYGYVLKRSASKRCISVCVRSDNTVVVSCPQKFKLEQIKKFLEEKRGWIEKHLRRNRQINERFSSVISCKCVLVKGITVPLFIGSTEEFSSDRVCLRSLTRLKNAFIYNLNGEFNQLLDKICTYSGLGYVKTSFRDYKARWGCCSADKQLTFNYRLLMLPQYLWAYVIVHELCHTLHMNHSASFWGCVEKILPDYKKLRTDLKAYSFLCSMY